MATNLPDCSTITPTCTSCLFGGLYSTVDPPFTVTAESTYIPTIVVDVTTFANGSSTTNTILSATDTPDEDVLTWESDGITFTYGTTYLNYTEFLFATPSPSASDDDPTLACYTGNPDDITTTRWLVLPEETAASSLIVTLASEESLPSLTVPAQILNYLETLPTVSEQLNGIPLSVCSPTTTPQQSCTSSIPDNCPQPTNTTTVTAREPSSTVSLTKTIPRGYDDSKTYGDNSMRKRKESMMTTASTSQSSTTGPITTQAASTLALSSSASSSFPPGCPTVITVTASSAATFPDSPATSVIQSSAIELEPTQKISTNRLNVGPASISIRSAISLAAAAQPPPTTPSLIPNDTPEYASRLASTTVTQPSPVYDSEKSTTGVGDYIQSGMNPAQDGESQTKSASVSVQAYTGHADRVDVRGGLLGIGMGILFAG